MEPNELEELAEKANKFVKDVIPQIGSLCIQDYANLNELCILLSKFESQSK